MTRLSLDQVLRRETSAVRQGRALVVELRTHTLTIRLKGKRRGYVVDFQSIFELGASKEAKRQMLERALKRRGKRR